jgi:uncharacterized protein
MSSLRDKLKRLNVGNGGKSAGVTEGAAASSADAVEPKDTTSPPLDSTDLHKVSESAGNAEAAFTVEPLDADWSKLDAALVRNAYGSFIRRRRVYPWDHVHGDIRLGDIQGITGELSAFHEGSPVRAGQLLFFDTETTGLGLGAGNVPFMIGLGFGEAEGFAVEQLFIRNPAEELAMLAYLKPFMEKYPYLVSYNGKSFDWPLLKNRFVMNRMKDGIAEPLHFDFLYPSRSLWKNTLPSCRLGKVEEAQLGFHRVDDVPGSMAPTLYFLYLAEKRPGDIGPVFIHNEYDILSLAGLAVLFAGTLAGYGDPVSKSPEEKYRLGLWLHKMRKEELSQEILTLLVAELCMAIPADVQPLLVPLAGHYKQLGAWEEAVDLWERSIQAVKDSGTRASPPLEPYIELSMYYEHRIKDYMSALMYAEEALAWTEDRISSMEALLRRTGRLRNRNRKAVHEGDARTETTDSISNPASGVMEDLNKRISRLKKKLHRTLPPQSDREAEEFTAEERVNRKRYPKPAGSVHETLTLF